ncbi:DUF3313 family protein [Acetobacter okinawensis]|uniref:DUF3313 family protein n=1 Tax=Acetobacter okinawensis TaxID=1076594 RepID=UPI002011C75C|nr:DUF3313 family protein [Acetobacter okinawensis]
MTTTIIRSTGYYAALMLFLAMSGCAGQKVTHSGFLPEETYSEMTPQKGHTEDKIYVKPGFDGAKYKIAVIDPVVWHPIAKAPHLTPEVAARMTDAFTDEIKKNVGKYYTIIDPSVCGACTEAIHIRAAITNIRRSKWYYNAIPVVAGFAAGAAGGGLPPIPPPFPGGASEELIAADGTTGETLVAIATYNNGMPWNMMGQWMPYLHAKRAFHLAAQLLAEEFKNNGAIQLPKEQK